ARTAGGTRRGGGPRRDRLHLGERRAPLVQAHHVRPPLARGTRAAPRALRAARGLVMDLRFGAEDEKLRGEVRGVCASSWPLRGDEATLGERERAIAWRKRALAAGFLHRTVPRAYGGAGAELDVMAETVVRQELDRAAVPHRGVVQGTHMLVPTLLECGSEEQRRRYIPPTLTGELVWCQGYSEPGAGSDLASLQSRAELVGDAWVLNGQKIWTSQADQADMMFGLFRTEPDAPKHAGISYLLIPMSTPGITVRPLTMMQGGQDFC